VCSGKTITEEFEMISAFKEDILSHGKVCTGQWISSKGCETTNDESYSSWQSVPWNE